MEKKNSGFTLIELIISMAILAVLGIAIGTFFYTSTRQYGRASAEVELQTESQMVANQMRNLIYDTTQGIYTVQNEDGAYQSTDSLILYGYDERKDRETKILLEYQSDAQQIVYTRFYMNTDEENAEHWEVDGDTKEECFARYVTSFSVDLCDGEGNLLTQESGKNLVEQVRLSLFYQLNQNTYTSEFSVTPRNTIYIRN